MKRVLVAVAACMLLIITDLAPAVAQNFSGWVFARKLQTFDSASAIAVEPLDDNSESVAVAEAVKQQMTKAGLALADGGPFVLEIEVDPAFATGIGRQDEPLKRDNRPMASRDRGDSLRQLAPTDELAPSPNSTSRERLVGIPHLAVTLNLYNQDAVPVWTATATARRNNRPLKEQSVQLALAALSYMGKSVDREPIR